MRLREVPLSPLRLLLLLPPLLLRRGPRFCVVRSSAGGLREVAELTLDEAAMAVVTVRDSLLALPAAPAPLRRAIISSSEATSMGVALCLFSALTSAPVRAYVCVVA